MATIILLVVLLPTGPDVNGSEVADSVGQAWQNDKEAPPASDGRASRYKTLSCKRSSAISNASWDCTLDADIGALPDATIVYKVDVESDKCWRAAPSGKSGNPQRVFLEFSFSGCVGR